VRPIFGLKDYLQRSTGSVDDILIAASDGDLDKMARATVIHMAIPQERVHIIRSNLQWLKEDAAERRSHCKHICMVEQNHHAISLGTLYAENPDKIYLCVKTGMQSPRGSNDRSSLLIQFKAYYCLGCSFKEPNQ
jgi:hypothetical protein